VCGEKRGDVTRKSKGAAATGLSVANKECWSRT